MKNVTIYTIIIGCLFLSQSTFATDSLFYPLLQTKASDQILKEIHNNNEKVVLVNVWATWCQPCREEFPDILKLYRNYKEKGLELILISADFDRQEGNAKQFLAQQGVEFVSYRKIGKDEDFVNILNPKWSGALPASFIYVNGKLVDFWEGKTNYEIFEKKVTQQLKSLTK